MKASFRERHVPIKTGKGNTIVKVMPGQFIFGRLTASKELKMPPSSIRNRMDKLKNAQNLDMQSDSHYSLVTITNWDTYQNISLNQDSDQDRQRTGKGQAKDTNNKDKKVNKDKKEKILYMDVIFLAASEYEKLIEKYGQESTTQAIEILNNAIMSKGYKYKSHYHTIIGWPMKEAQGGRTGNYGGTGKVIEKTGRARSDDQPYPVDHEC